MAVSLAGTGRRTAMNRSGSTTGQADPWSVPVTVAQIPDTGLHRDIEAGQATREAMAELGGLREMLSASASLDVTPKGGGRVHVAGRVKARIGQTCVVSLDPIESDIDEAIDLIFAPPEQIPELADLVDEAAESDCRYAGSAGADRERRHRSRPAGDRCAVPRRSIPIRASRMRCSRRRSWRPIPRTIRLPRSRRSSSMPNRPRRRSPEALNRARRVGKASLQPE